MREGSRVSAPRIAGPAPLAPELAEAILRTVPEWFGQEQALLDYAQDAASLPTFTAAIGGETLAFATLRPHFAETAEINCIAVSRQHHGHGLGSALVAMAERWWQAQGGRLLQVKTIGPSHPDPNYARTREFYRRVGFLPVEEFATLWSARHPCLLLVKPIG